MCFQVDNKSPHAAQFVKSSVLNKAIDSIISIDTFEQQCVIIKCMLKSSRIDDHMKTIGIDQSSFTRSSYDLQDVMIVTYILLQHIVAQMCG